MNSPDFIGYLNDPDIHDGTILKVQQSDTQVRVLVRSYEGQLYVYEFDQVESVKSVVPEGMMLYSLTEMLTAEPFRRFVFTNWDEEGEGILEVVAQQIGIRKLENEAAF